MSEEIVASEEIVTIVWESEPAEIVTMTGRGPQGPRGVASAVAPLVLSGDILSLGSSYTATAVDYDVASADEVVDCVATVTVRLPDAAAVTGRRFTVKNSASATITIARSSSQTFDGVNADVGVAPLRAVEVISDGDGWVILTDDYQLHASLDGRWRLDSHQPLASPTYSPTTLEAN